MKGIVVGVRDDQAAVLGDDGSVENVRNRGYQIGDVIAVNTFRRSGSRQFRLLASVAALVAVFTVSAFAYTTPVGYVSIDVNPSIQYEINVLDRVLSIEAVNGDAKDIVDKLDVKNMNIQKAMRATIEELIAAGYFDDSDENGIVVTTGSDNSKKALKLAEQLRLRVQEVIDDEGKSADVQSEAVGLARVMEARALDVTPGKLNLVQKLSETQENWDEIYDQAYWLDRSVKEINKKIQANKKEMKHTDQDNNNSNSNNNENANSNSNNGNGNGNGGGTAGGGGQ
jgi:uncharacterized membrane protein YgcG